MDASDYPEGFFTPQGQFRAWQEEHGGGTYEDYLAWLDEQQVGS